MPRGTSKLTSSSAFVSPKDFTSPSTVMAWSVTAGTLPCPRPRTETSADWVGKLSGSALILSALSAGISLVSLAELAPRHRWVYRLGVTLAIVLATALLLVIWWQPAATDWYLRVTGVLAVAVAAITLVIPALHRVAAQERRTSEAARTPVAFCPVCGAPIASPNACETCGVTFAVTFVAPPRTPPGTAAPVTSRRPRVSATPKTRTAGPAGAGPAAASRSRAAGRLAARVALQARAVAGQRELAAVPARVALVAAQAGLVALGHHERRDRRHGTAGQGRRRGDRGRAGDRVGHAPAPARRPANGARCSDRGLWPMVSCRRSSGFTWARSSRPR